MKIKLWWLLHNCIGHPVSGVFYFLGLERLGRFAHDITLPKE